MTRLCEEQRVFDDVVYCELDEHPFDDEHPCRATVVSLGIEWQLTWRQTDKAATDGA